MLNETQTGLLYTSTFETNYGAFYIFTEIQIMYEMNYAK